MLRAEQALDKARANGRDGFAVYEPSPQRETARLRQMQIADEVVQALKENRLQARLPAHRGGALAQGVALRMPAAHGQARRQRS